MEFTHFTVVDLDEDVFHVPTSTTSAITSLRSEVDLCWVVTVSPTWPQHTSQYSYMMSFCTRTAPSGTVAAHLCHARTPGDIFIGA
jgi:hypothetical protein